MVEGIDLIPELSNNLQNLINTYTIYLRKKNPNINIR